VTTLRDSLLQVRDRIAAAGSDEAHLEAELLLAHALGIDRTHLYQRLDEQLPLDAAAPFEALVRRRLSHEPIPYIVGHKEFYGIELEVTPAAIIPRPETETLVEIAVDFARPRITGREFRVADVGTGCGAIAVALALELPEAEISAIDVSAEALALARRNAERHGLADRVRFLEGDLLAPLGEPADVIVANLPYVLSADFEAGPPEIREHEPRLGLDGGPDGLRLIDRLLREAPPKLRPGGALFAEIGEGQGQPARDLAAAAFPSARIEVRKDLSTLDRVLAVLT
jgi:release factor glutamine methyltransferase